MGERIWGRAGAGRYYPCRDLGLASLGHLRDVEIRLGHPNPAQHVRCGDIKKRLPGGEFDDVPEEGIAEV